MSKPTLRLFSHLDNASAFLVRPDKGQLYVEIERGHASCRIVADWSMRDGSGGQLDFHTTPINGARQAAALFLQKADAILDD